MRKIALFLFVATISLASAVSCKEKDMPSNEFAGSVWMMSSEYKGTSGFEAYRFSEDMTYEHWFEDGLGHVVQWYEPGYYEVRPDFSVIALDYKTTQNVCAYSGNPPTVFLYNRDQQKKFLRQRE